MLILRYALAGIVLLLVAGAVATAFMTWRIEERYPPSGRFVDVRGGRLHYVEAGPEPGQARGTIVLLHGASSNLADPMLVLGKALASRYRVIAFDRPGHGWSDRIAGADAAQPSRQASILAEAMRALGLRDTIVVGHSWSGSVVPNLALDHADVAGAIVILSGVTHAWPGGAISWYYHPATSLLGWIFTRTITTPAGMLLVPAALEGVFAPQKPPADYAEAARIGLVLRPSSFHANAQDVAVLHDAVAAQSHRYPQIRIPTVVMGGDADRIVRTDHHARSFVRDVPSAKLVVLPGVGHMPHITHAERIVAEIDEVAAKLKAPAEARLP